MVGGFIRALSALLIELIQTDEFIDPLRESTDLIFRIGALTDSSFHARIFGTQKYHLAASPQYVAKYGTLDHPTELNQHKCLVYKVVLKVLTAG